MKYLSVCSGMEAATVAWHPLGWEPIGFSEIEPFPAAILKHRFPNTPNYGDLTKYNEWPIEPGAIDLLVGGTPCQSFSVAGLRRGLADPRGNLALVFLGLADKLRPRWIVWENVPGVLSSSGGRDLGAFLGALGQLGYGWAFRVLDAQHLGVPQRRRRVFVVATSSGDGRLAGEVLSLPEGLRGYLASRQQKGKGPAADAGAGVEADGLQRTVGTLCADTHPGAYSGQDAYTGRLIPFRKAKRAQSTTDDESWVEGEVSNTLNNFDLGDTRTTHAVVEPFAFTQNQREEVRLLGDKTGAVSASGGTHQTNYVAEPAPLMFKVRGGVEANDGSQGGEPGKTAGKGFLGSEDKAFTLAATQDQWLAQPIAIQGTIIGRGENASPQGVGATEGGPMFTLTKTDIHGVAHCSDVAPTVTSSGPPYSRTGKERVEAEALVTEPITFQPGNIRREAGADPSTRVTTTLKATPGDQMPHVATPPPSMAVRRLTPVECERLQGFPDNWSRIPWKGKPEEDCPDGPRYKACGNSMAVPVMRWIGQRIALVEQRTNGKNG